MSHLRARGTRSTLARLHPERPTAGRYEFGTEAPAPATSRRRPYVLVDRPRGSDRRGVTGQAKAAPTSPTPAFVDHTAVDGGVVRGHRSGLEARGVRTATVEVRALLAPHDAGDSGRERAGVLGGHE